MAVVASKTKDAGDAGTRKAILDAAELLIQTRGANAISYATISELVGIRKASIHHHFATKDLLVEQLVERYSADFLRAVDAIIAEDTRAPAKLKAYIRLFDKTLRAVPGERVCLCGMLGAELDSLSPKAASDLQRFYRNNEERLAAILEAGRKEGTLKFDGDPRVLGMSIFAFLEGALIVARADRGARQFGQLSSRVLRLVSA